MTSTEDCKELLQSLIRAKKNLRIYPDNNPIYAKTLNDLHQRFAAFLEADGPLVLKIKQYDILHEDEVAYHKEDREDNLALLFFRDGVRELSFKPGLPKEEVEDFLKVLSADIAKESDEDIVTLMWERDFQFIRYIVDDTILLEDEIYQEKPVAEIKEAVDGSEGIMRAYEDAVGVESSAAANIVPLTNDDVKSIIEEIENEPEDKTDILCRMLFEMLHDAEGTEEFDEIVSLIGSTLEQAISIGNLETVLCAVRKAREAVDRGTYPPERSRSLEGVEASVNSTAFLTPFGRFLDNGGQFPSDKLRTFSSLLVASAIPHLLSLLGELKNISSRKIITALLVDLGKQDLAAVARGLQDERWFVVRNVIYVLRQIGDRGAVEHLTAGVRHSDQRVRREAIKALGEMGTEDVLPVLKDCLKDEDETIRVTAVRAIGVIGTPSARSSISAFVTEKDFRDRSFTEKQEVFEVLARWREQETVDLIIGILEKGALFRRTKNDETRAAAAHCAGLMGAAKATDALSRLKKAKSRVLRDHVAIAMKRIDDGENG